MSHGRSFRYTLCSESSHQRRYMRGGYQVLPIRDALRRELSWTHYRLLLVELQRAREVIEAQQELGKEKDQP